jgi:protein SCO1/2
MADDLNPKLLFRAFQILLGVALGLSVAFLWVSRQPGNRTETEVGESYFLPSPLPAPEFSLVSHQGARVSSGDFPGKVLAVFFGYTSCPDVCPLTLTHLTTAFREMGETGARVQVLLITVDPARDTPERLAAYMRNFHPSFLGLTGSEEEIRGVADGFGVYFSKSEGTDQEGSYTVDHTARTFLIDRYGRIPLTFPVTATPEEMARDMTTLIEISGG